MAVVAGLIICVAPVRAAIAAPLHKRISVKYTNQRVADVLKDIELQTGVRFTYAENLLETADNVTCEAADTEAGRVATQILRPRGFKLKDPDGVQVTVEKLEPQDEARPAREQSFDFAEKPKLTRNADTVTITFATRGWCDATVAVVNANGKIIRHLASGVLGPNAPEPFLWNSKPQTPVWDGKNEVGEYVDDKEALTVRVSLGLKAAYERPLFWEPKKRTSPKAPFFCASPEGVYV